MDFKDEYYDEMENTLSDIDCAIITMLENDYDADTVDEIHSLLQKLSDFVNEVAFEIEEDTSYE